MRIGSIITFDMDTFTCQTVGYGMWFIHKKYAEIRHTFNFGIDTLQRQWIVWLVDTKKVRYVHYNYQTKTFWADDNQTGVKHIGKTLKRVFKL